MTLTEAEEYAIVAKKVESPADIITAADANVRFFEGDAVDANHDTILLGGSTQEQHILVLGAGRVASSLVEYLGRSNSRKIVVASAVTSEVQSVARRASAVTSEVQSVARRAKSGKAVVLDVARNPDGPCPACQCGGDCCQLASPPMHATVAEACICAK
ncbi:MAG: saccharopine dehydrogenase NADP-binding domain-containing protein [Gaiellaceae bacterium]